ncbi:MAG: VanZ family protein [Ignavibacterium sp.]|nr:VanZ family protein [Ignavibacterium sp.]
MYSYLQTNKKYLVQLPLIIYWIILFILTSLPSTMAIATDINDKLNHFGAYGLLSVLLYLNMHFQEKIKILSRFPEAFTVLIASVYGFLDEIHQMFVPGRSAEFLDWLADFLGSVTAVLITGYILRKFKQNEFEKNKLKAGTF